MSIIIPDFIGPDYSAMQGPCPSGFHIPTKDEREDLIYAGINIGVWDSGDGYGMCNKLKMVYRGYRTSGGNVGTSYGYYWCSEKQGGAYGYALRIYSNILEVTGTYTTRGLSIRPFKNIPVHPLNGEILKDGWTIIDGNEFTGNVVARNQSEGLISLTYNDGRKCITISDKNVGATEVWTGSSTIPASQGGKHFQWGNNYGFPNTGSITSSTSAIDASSYGPGNYYSSSTMREPSSGAWDSSDNYNLRGGVATTKGELKKRYVWVEGAIIDFLLVGGGGSGAAAGGGGGAGGVLVCNEYPISNGCHNIEIGQGGQGYCGSRGVSGGNSVFDNNIAYGGGGGGATCCDGFNGGSGGGGSQRGTCTNLGKGGCGCPGQGNNGGDGHCNAGGGGGGAGSVGGNAEARIAGSGGNGIQSDISGEMCWYGGGGGGAEQYYGNCVAIGGCGGGGNGLFFACTAAQKNASNASYYGGGGGSMASSCNTECCYSKGCQGVFIARYPTACGYNISGGTCYTCGNYTIHRFTSNGTLTIN